ncbi:hypothetical protein Bca52824_056839 [Brassica carinata]|uniref:COBRA C-terminal domain-containing protein n=1 Tax=Brassica carinata TaxID=52824 RepID=A0A8X7QW53_BRACI|nr:hypothetical protein Bca52824_056839 [Brassica carinata]
MEAWDEEVRDDWTKKDLTIWFGVNSLAQNRTAFFPPQHLKIDGIVNPQYKCGPPVRMDPTGFPDPSGLQATTYAFASWQVICNITKPKPKDARCSLTQPSTTTPPFFATLALALAKTSTPTHATPMLDSFSSLRTRSWYRLKTGRSRQNGDWFAAVDLDKAGLGYENVYSFNGSRVPPNNQTIFFQGLRGIFLIGLTNGTHPAREPKVPGKMQSVISFKKHLGTLNIRKGDGFPKRVFFNGEECELPKFFPKKSSGLTLSGIGFLPLIPS